MRSGATALHRVLYQMAADANADTQIGSRLFASSPMITMTLHESERLS